MKKSRRIPFYLPNYTSSTYEQPIFDPQDNLYNNPDENDGQTFYPKAKEKIKKSKNSEKDRFDEI